MGTVQLGGGVRGFDGAVNAFSQRKSRIDEVEITVAAIGWV